MSHEKETIHIRIVPREVSLDEAIKMTFDSQGEGAEIREGHATARRQYKARKRFYNPSFGSEAE